MLSEFPRTVATLFHAAQELGRETRKIVLPSPCICCGVDLPLRPRQRVGSCCLGCWLSLKSFPLPICQFCGTPLQSPLTRCLGCPKRSPIDWRESWGPFEGTLREVIHAYKFRQHDFLAPDLAELLRQTWFRRGREEVDAVVSIPSGKRRKRERGYDHALLLARHFARRTGLVANEKLLRRLRDNEVQSLLPKSRRAENVRGVFEAAQEVEDKSILLIDDIETTGETLRAAARALRGAGATSVAALTIARA